MSRVMILGDVHLLAVRPVGRTDDIVETEFRKLEYILETARSSRVDVIIQPGDLWNQATPPYSLVTRFAKLLRKYKEIPWFTVFGQHDMVMRSSNRDRTATGLLEGLGMLTVLKDSGFVYRDIIMFGASYGDDYAPVEENMKEQGNGRFKILVTHDSIGTEPLFPGHKLTKADRFLKVWPQANLIVCGDYHYPFVIRSGGRAIINAGCMLRLTRSFRDVTHKPRVYIYDTSTNIIDKIMLGSQKSSDVFSGVAYTTEASSVSDEMLVFIDELRRADNVGVSFLENLKRILAEKGASLELYELLGEVLHNGEIGKLGR